MTDRNRHKEFFLKQKLRVHIFLHIHPVQNDHIKLTVPKHLPEIRKVSLPYHQIDLRPASLIFGNHRRQEKAAPPLGDSKTDPPCRLPGDFFDLLVEFPLQLEHLFCSLHILFPCISQCKLLSAPVKQRSPKIFFQICDINAESRLRNIKSFCRSRQVSKLCQCADIFLFPKIHEYRSSLRCTASGIEKSYIFFNPESQVLRL